MDEDFPAYVISGAGQPPGLPPHPLRQHDRPRQAPPRRPGRPRLYSLRDIQKLDKVQQLTAAGLNLEGIRRVLELEEEVVELRSRLQRYEHEERSTALVVWRPGRRG